MTTLPHRDILTSTSPVRMVPMDGIAATDRQFDLRAWLDIDDLVESVRRDGLLVPLTMRTRTDGRMQVVSGFRRLAAAMAAGMKYVPAIVRNDLDDTAAFEAAVVENTRRASYSDIDRAHIIQKYRDAGHESLDIARLMGISKRQKNHLASLLDLPLPVQRAVADPRVAFTTTHAIVLQKWARRHPLDLQDWVRRIDREGLSVRAVDRALAARQGRSGGGFESLLAGGLGEQQVVRIRGQRLRVEQMSAQELTRLRGELVRLLEFLDGRNLRHRRSA